MLCRAAATTAPPALPEPSPPGAGHAKTAPSRARNPGTGTWGAAARGGRRTHGSDHFADEDDGGPPGRAGRQDPATVELEQKLRAGVDVNASAVLPATRAQTEVTAAAWRQRASSCSRPKADGNLELSGDVGGDGTGTSASSSSSSSHSSSRRGVMLFPSHTEWMDTCKGHESGSTLGPAAGGSGAADPPPGRAQTHGTLHGRGRARWRAPPSGLQSLNEGQPNPREQPRRGGVRRQDASAPERLPKGVSAENGIGTQGFSSKLVLSLVVVWGPPFLNHLLQVQKGEVLINLGGKVGTNLGACGEARWGRRQVGPSPALVPCTAPTPPCTGAGGGQPQAGGQLCPQSSLQAKGEWLFGPKAGGGSGPGFRATQCSPTAFSGRCGCRAPGPWRTACSTKTTEPRAPRLIPTKVC